MKCITDLIRVFLNEFVWIQRIKWVMTKSKMVYQETHYQCEKESAYPLLSLCRDPLWHTTLYKHHTTDSNGNIFLLLHIGMYPLSVHLVSQTIVLLSGFNEFLEFSKSHLGKTLLFRISLFSHPVYVRFYWQRYYFCAMQCAKGERYHKHRLSYRRDVLLVDTKN